MFATPLSRLNTYMLSQRDVTKIAIGFCLMTIGANIQIPIQPVPITLHTVALFFIALMYTPRNAFLTVLSYILIMAAGAPIGSGFMGGMAKIIGPAGGFVIIMPVAAFVVSYLQRHVFSDKWYMMVANTCLGTTLLYVVGVSWLSYQLGSIEKGIALGLIPFVLPGVLKAVILSLTVYGIKTSLTSTQQN